MTLYASLGLFVRHLDDRDEELSVCGTSSGHPTAK